MLRFLIDLLFPQWCCSCSRYGTLLCFQCFQRIEFSAELKRTFTYVDSLSNTTHYNSITRSLIHTLKYSSVKDVAKICSYMMFFYSNYIQADYITAIPLHQYRLNERGFNQAEEIAKQFSSFSEIPYVPFLNRVIHANNLAAITVRSTRKNVIKNQFSLNDLYTVQLQNKTILLIDDVWTTGSTVEEAARMLKYGKAVQVHGLTFTHRA